MTLHFENVTINALMPTLTGTSKAGNPYAVKEVVFGLPTNNPAYASSIMAKAMNQEIIAQLEQMQPGDTIASIDVDPQAQLYNGRYYNEMRLWRMAAVHQPVQNDPFAASAAQQLNDLGF